MDIKKIVTQIRSDSPVEMATSLSANVIDSLPGWVGEVVMVVIGGSESFIGVDGRSDNDLAVQLASMFQDFIMSVTACSWPEIRTKEGGFIGVLDIKLTAAGPVWIHPAFAPVSLGRLRIEVASRGVVIVRPLA